MIVTFLIYFVDQRQNNAAVRTNCELHVCSPTAQREISKGENVICARFRHIVAHVLISETSLVY